ncbi:UNVERIFIED_ORG: hypothetical protein QFZ59_000701 [Bacillus sp. B2I3]|nr:hypothetical protein [Bacillus sp. B2I3]
MEIGLDVHGFCTKQGSSTFHHRDVLGLNHLASFTPLPGNRLMRLPGMLRGGVTTIYADKHPFAGGKDHYSLYFEDPDRMKVELAAP